MPVKEFDQEERAEDWEDTRAPVKPPIARQEEEVVEELPVEPLIPPNETFPEKPGEWAE